MLHRRIIAVGFLTCLAWQSCASDTQTPPQESKTKAEPPQMEETLPPGLHVKVFAQGHPHHGEPTQEWTLYEEMVTDESGHELYHKSLYSALAETVRTFYDSTGHETLAVHASANPADSAEFKTQWSGDYSERTTEEYMDGKLVSKTKSRYNKLGQLLSQEIVDDHVPEVTQKSQNRMVYDDKGHLSEVRELIQGKEILGTRHTYDATGNCVQTEHFDATGKPSQIETFTYDAQGRMHDRHMQDLSAYFSSTQLQARYEYDAKGRLLRETHYFRGHCDAAGEQAGICLTAETITLTYDAEGRIATELREKVAQPPVTMRKRFEYSTNP